VKKSRYMYFAHLLVDTKSENNTTQSSTITNKTFDIRVASEGQEQWRFSKQSNVLWGDSPGGIQ
jgi:hypothetical protein